MRRFKDENFYQAKMAPILFSRRILLDSIWFNSFLLAENEQVPYRFNQHYGNDETVCTACHPAFLLKFIITAYFANSCGIFFREVHEAEIPKLAGRLIPKDCPREEFTPEEQVLHSDNGFLLKWTTMQTALLGLTTLPSFCPPR